MNKISMRLSVQIQRWLVLAGRAASANSPHLLDELTRVFLEPLIADRTGYLLRQGDPSRSETDVGKDVRAEYAQALQQAVALQCQSFGAEAFGTEAFGTEAFGTEAFGAQALGVDAQGHQLLSALELLAQPQRLFVIGELGAVDLHSLKGLTNLLARIRPREMGLRVAMRRAPLLTFAPQAVARILLSAAQHAATAMVLRDHQGAATPERTRLILDALLEDVDAIALRLDVFPPIATRTWWSARLQVAYARNVGQVHLPLRPIATAALQFAAPAQRYAGRADDEPLRLARQLRHADGVVLVTGYRGVGKSTFVNRALFHAVDRQHEARDGWLVVPVVLSVAKSAGISNVLRLTLRAIKHALVDDTTGRARPVPGAALPTTLPISAAERALLDVAYIRATWNVAVNRAAIDEGEWNADVGLSVDPGKLFGGAFGALAKLGAKRSRTERLSRELSLRDYDEDAAEADIARLTDSLATARRYASGKDVRIKLVIVFDELDKLDFDTGVKPLLDGMKNLFLRQNTVFLLVTSKQVYYTLRNQRAIEDATLSSYFSAVVHVPLLDFAQVRTLLEGWLDQALLFGPTPEAAAVEARTLEKLARYLTYRSLGNPRELIRELRSLQSWTASGDAPFITDRITQLPEVAIYAALQQVIEKAAVPWQGATAASAAEAQPGEVTLASERVSTDEARLEQLRRGLYIMVEAAIDQQTLHFDQAGLASLHKNNFSLFSIADVQRLARQLSRQLANLRTDVLDNTSSDAAAPPTAPLFTNGGTEAQPTLTVTSAFYRLTGRHALGDEAKAVPSESAPRTVARTIKEAQAFFAHGGRAERWSAIDLVGELDEAQIPADLIEQLRRVAHDDADTAYRVAAIENTPAVVLLGEDFRLVECVTDDSDDKTVAAVVAKVAEAAKNEQVSTGEQRARATDTLLHVLRCDGATARKLPAIARYSSHDERPNPHYIVALELLVTLADADITPQLKRLLLVNGPLLRGFAIMQALNDAVIDAAMRTLLANANCHELDLRELLLADAAVLQASHLHNALLAHLKEIVGDRFGEALFYLLDVPPEGTNVDELARPVVSAAAAAHDDATLRMLLGRLTETDPHVLAVNSRIHRALKTSDFDGSVAPALRAQLAQLSSTGNYDAQRMARSEKELQRAAELPRAATSSLSDTIASATRLLGNSTLFGLDASTLVGRDYLQPNPVALSLDERLRHLSDDFRPYQRPREFSFDALGAAMLLASVVPFAVTLYLPGDLPANAGTVTMLLSRALSLCMPLAMLVTMIMSMSNIRVSITAGRSDTATPARVSDQILWMVPMFAFIGVPELHKQWVGAMTFFPQLIFFVLNSLALGLGYFGIARMFK